jgi:proteasome lid subunit RPN8/RPN11
MNTVILKKADYQKILDHCRAGLPDEACGLVAGHIDGDVKTIEKVYPCENTDHTNEHFTISPEDQLKAIKDARANGLTMIGNFHSHPETPSRQSEEDKRLAYDYSASYLLLSLATEEPVLNSFHYDGKDSTKENLIIQ